MISVNHQRILIDSAILHELLWSSLDWCSSNRNFFKVLLSIDISTANCNRTIILWCALGWNSSFEPKQGSLQIMVPMPASNSNRATIARWDEVLLIMRNGHRSWRHLLILVLLCGHLLILILSWGHLLILLLHRRHPLRRWWLLLRRSLLSDQVLLILFLCHLLLLPLHLLLVLLHLVLHIRLRILLFLIFELFH